MKPEDKIIKELSLKHGKDPRIIRQIATFPLKFTKRIMADYNDERPIRIRYFGAFVQKDFYNKETKVSSMLEEMLDDKNIESVFIIMVSVLGFPTASIDGAKRIIQLAEESKDYEKIKYIWEAWRSSV